MFAYCGNNPVNYCDSSGAYPRKAALPIAIDPEGCSPWITPPSTSHYGDYGSIGIKISQAVNNNDEQDVIDAEHFAFYKGAPVVKIPFMETSAFSYGIILMGSDVNDPNLVRHEYGHVQQLDEIGLADYTTFVVLPSVTCFYLTEFGMLKRSMYYSLPWEYVANMYGQAEGHYTEWAGDAAQAYWAIVKALTR